MNSSPYSWADATGGDPSRPPFEFSPHLARALLDQEARIYSVWPAFSDLRAAAHAAKQSRGRNVISAAVCEARLIFAAAFLVAHGAPRSAWPLLTSTGMTSWIQALFAHGSAFLQSRWLRATREAPAPWSSTPLTVLPISSEMIDWPAPARPYPAILISPASPCARPASPTTLAGSATRRPRWPSAQRARPQIFHVDLAGHRRNGAPQGPQLPHAPLH